MGTFFFVKFEGSANNATGIVDNEYAFNWSLDPVDCLFDVFCHLSCNIYEDVIMIQISTHINKLKTSWFYQWV